jgi:NADH-quinone oxidoreductase subunit N
MTPQDLLLLAPILILAIASLKLLMVGSFTRSANATGVLAGASCLVAAAVLVYLPSTGPVFPLEGGGHLVQFSPFGNMASLLMLLLALPCLPLLAGGLKGKAHRPEVYVLLVLSLTGMLLLVSAANLLTLYMGLELMSFPLYILAAYLRDDAKSSEAGLKYFVLGSLATGLMLFGISLLFASIGTLSFNGLFGAINRDLFGGNIPPLVLMGATLTLLGALFKLSVVPFHMWTPDVYEGAPTPVTAIMGVLPKLAAFVLLVRLLHGPFAGLQYLWQPALAYLAIASMLVGGTLAVVQTNLKRLLAYSTIANVGFIMVGVVAATAQGSSGVLFYLAVYAVTTLGIFATLMASGAHTVDDLKGLAQRSPWLAASFLLFLFSLAGVPPLAGFMGKLTVFMAAVQAGYAPLAIVGVLASVIALFYSLWLVKVIYFDAPEADAKPLPAIHPALPSVIMLAAVVTLALGLFPVILTDFTLPAAAGIF